MTQGALSILVLDVATRTKKAVIHVWSTVTIAGGATMEARIGTPALTWATET